MDIVKCNEIAWNVMNAKMSWHARTPFNVINDARDAVRENKQHDAAPRAKTKNDPCSCFSWDTKKRNIYIYIHTYTFINTCLLCSSLYCFLLYVWCFLVSDVGSNICFLSQWANEHFSTFAAAWTYSSISSIRPQSRRYVNFDLCSRLNLLFNLDNFENKNLVDTS